MSEFVTASVQVAPGQFQLLHPRRVTSSGGSLWFRFEAQITGSVTVEMFTLTIGDTVQKIAFARPTVLCNGDTLSWDWEMV